MSRYQLPLEQQTDTQWGIFPSLASNPALTNTWKKQSVVPDIIYYFSCQKCLHLNVLLDIQISVRGEESFSSRLMKSFAGSCEHRECEYFVRNWHIGLIRSEITESHFYV